MGAIKINPEIYSGTRAGRWQALQHIPETFYSGWTATLDYYHQNGQVALIMIGHQKVILVARGGANSAIVQNIIYNDNNYTTNVSLSAINATTIRITCDTEQIIGVLVI